MDPRSNKRRRVSRVSIDQHDSDCEIIEVPTAARPLANRRRTSFHSLLGAPISPPPTRREFHEYHEEDIALATKNALIRPANDVDSPALPQKPINARLIPSPIQLSTVNGLARSTNVDTVSLRDILGDPLIKECWLFNYLIDVDFVMSQMDQDTRHLVQVRIIHGSWKKEDSNRINIEASENLETNHSGAQEAAKKYENIQIIIAYMAEIYGE
ncbi:MAG: hypothetical protein Q9209_004386 [Squamulea sp. 1 TL-2023]